MSVCPACGTDNREWASHCGECGRPLPHAPERPAPPPGPPDVERLPTWLRPAQTASPSARPADRPGRDLPPIPDGGLAGGMPIWLAPNPPVAPAHHGLPDTPAASPPEEETDVTRYLTPDDLPAWLRRLADTPTAPPPAPTGWTMPVPPAGPALGDEPAFVPAAPRPTAAGPVARPASPLPPPPPTSDERTIALVAAGFAAVLALLAVALVLVAVLG